jgi:hypothetical protein
MDSLAASQLVMDTLAYAVAGDADRAATALQDLGVQSNGNQMYGVCCALAEAGTIALRRIYGDQAPNPTFGDMWVMQQLVPGALEEDPPKAFSMRFLVAYANGHRDIALALYDAAYQASNDEYVDSVAALLATVAGITRLAIKEKGSVT